jgi:hypothetical protein
MPGNPVRIGDATLYLADCRGILPSLEREGIDTIIVDPVWPNVPAGMFDSAGDPVDLFWTIAAYFPQVTARVIVQLGCDVDPRFLDCIPRYFPFLRYCHLEFAFPSYSGRLLNGSEIAYAFGTWPESRPGRRVISGQCRSNQTRIGNNAVKVEGHPCPRNLVHVKWLVNLFVDRHVCDPMMGSGTTGVAALHQGVKFTGIEVNSAYFDLACKRIDAEYSQMKLFKGATAKCDEPTTSPASS